MCTLWYIYIYIYLVVLILITNTDPMIFPFAFFWITSKNNPAPYRQEKK